MLFYMGKVTADRYWRFFIQHLEAARNFLDYFSIVVSYISQSTTVIICWLLSPTAWGKSIKQTNDDDQTIMSRLALLAL